MTDKLREAAQLALETLEDVFGKHKVDVGAINALREALAEPEEPDLCWLPEEDMVDPSTVADFIADDMHAGDVVVADVQCAKMLPPRKMRVLVTEEIDGHFRVFWDWVEEEPK
jgi:hypothetical protein